MSEKKDSLGDRMKEYESKPINKLDPKLPAVIRVDGRAFHTYTKGFDRPYDPLIIGAMSYTAKALCEGIQNAKIAYTQSDEISVLMTTHEADEREPWFDGKVQKIVSNAASIATEAFNEYMDTHLWLPSKIKETISGKILKRKKAIFDARVFNIPFDEVVNCFLWRQQDAIRNSKSSLAQSKFSHKQLHGKNTVVMLEMLEKIGVIWSDLPINLQRGLCTVKASYDKDGTTRSKWVEDLNIPIFKDTRDYIGKFSKVEDPFKDVEIVGKPL